MYTLYSMQRSGNCYKVRLALAHLDVPYNLVEIDILKGESHTPDFLAKNPKPTVDQVKRGMNGNICRCGTYPRIVEAVRMAAGVKP